MNDLDDFVGWVIVVACVVFLIFLGWAMGASNNVHSVLSNYCESQSAQYEVIDGVDYCLKDNQLTAIEWMK